MTDIRLGWVAVVNLGVMVDLRLDQVVIRLGKVADLRLTQVVVRLGEMADLRLGRVVVNLCVVADVRLRVGFGRVADLWLWVCDCDVCLTTKSINLYFKSWSLNVHLINTCKFIV